MRHSESFSSGGGSLSVQPRIICVIVTHDRPECLMDCIAAVRSQRRAPDEIIVSDNASGPATAVVIAQWPEIVHLRQDSNNGGAAGFSAGIAVALARGADLVWLMDDDGRPADSGCLGLLLERASSGGDLVAPLVLDERQPERLAFPIRLRGRTLFDACDIVAHGAIDGFAHLFNGALIRRSVFDAIGLPDPRFFIRGDEIDFLYRARRAEVRIQLDPAARFLHPSSNLEIFPILFGRFYAVVPSCRVKRFYLFRNRAFIFRRYGMWMFLAMDVIRYASYFMGNGRGDILGFAHWVRVTITGLRGRFMQCDYGR